MCPRYLPGFKTAVRNSYLDVSRTGTYLSGIRLHYEMNGGRFQRLEITKLGGISIDESNKFNGHHLLLQPRSLSQYFFSLPDHGKEGERGSARIYALVTSSG